MARIGHRPRLCVPDGRRFGELRARVPRSRSNRSSSLNASADWKWCAEAFASPHDEFGGLSPTHMVSRMPNVLEYCNCVKAGLVIPAIHGFGSPQQRRLDGRQARARGGGTGARDLDQGACTLWIIPANIVPVRGRGRGRCTAKLVQRARPIVNTSNLDEGVKRR
jgi:hypothetical protein